MSTVLSKRRVPLLCECFDADRKGVVRTLCARQESVDRGQGAYHLFFVMKRENVPVSR